MLLPRTRANFKAMNTNMQNHMRFLEPEKNTTRGRKKENNMRYQQKGQKLPRDRRQTEVCKVVSFRMHLPLIATKIKEKTKTKKRIRKAMRMRTSVRIRRSVMMLRKKARMRKPARYRERTRLLQKMEKKKKGR